MCMQPPGPEPACSPDFGYSYLKSNAFEPAHTLIPQRKEKTHMQAIFEYCSGSFPIPEDPSLWLDFQRQKYERWTALYLTSLLTIELADRTVVKRYPVCPIFRSEIEKAPAVRQPVTPIVLPGRYVAENDNSWIESQYRQDGSRTDDTKEKMPSNNITSHDDNDTQKDRDLVQHLKYLEELFENVLPFKEYTSSTAQLNLISRLPDQYKKPGIGLEPHCEYGRALSGSRENMRCGRGFDMVNVVLSASNPDDMLSSTSRKSDATDAVRLKACGRPRLIKNSLEKEEHQNLAQLEKQRAVVWDIFPLSALDLLRNYLSERAAEYEAKQSAIHTQGVYLHSGFVAPERMVSIRQLSNEIAKPGRHSQRNYALPVMDILWWTWMGNETDRKKSADEIMKVFKAGAPRQNIHSGSDKEPISNNSKKATTKRRR
ncbi:Lysine-specific demethylase 3B [Coemansia sp. RSA 1646]|nr:Lysine-specific demethylase 3B [Coemansia sp. RSA 1646]KAJ1772218.1 Lysine-specific demethylase 3B [Coemansia sp. RSA 1843]